MSSNQPNQTPEQISMNLLGYLFLSFLMWLCLPSMNAQDLKQMDYQTLYTTSGVKQQKVYHINFENDVAVDTVIVQDWTFNKMGQPESVVNYFTEGKQHSIQNFCYNSLGTLTCNTMTLVSNSNHEMALHMLVDENGKVYQRELPDWTVQNWHREDLSYHDDGSIKMIEQWQRVDDTWRLFDRQEFPNMQADSEQRASNNLTRVYDQQGLPLIQNEYADNGDLKRTKLYTYEFNELTSR
jgi:hypothetical protein